MQFHGISLKVIMKQREEINEGKERIKKKKTLWAKRHVSYHIWNVNVLLSKRGISIHILTYF